jgi:hypothetical protein
MILHAISKVKSRSEIYFLNKIISKFKTQNITIIRSKKKVICLIVCGKVTLLLIMLDLKNFKV